MKYVCRANRKQTVLKVCNSCIWWLYRKAFHTSKCSVFICCCEICLFKYYLHKFNQWNNTALKITIDLSDNVQFLYTFPLTFAINPDYDHLSAKTECSSTSMACRIAAVFNSWSIAPFIASLLMGGGTQQSNRTHFIYQRLGSFGDLFLLQSSLQWEVNWIELRTTWWQVLRFDNFRYEGSIGARPYDVNGELLICYYWVCAADKRRRN